MILSPRWPCQQHVALGFETVVVHDGLAAWEHLTSSDPPPLAIVDWEMPGLEGPELCRRVRSDTERAHLTLIL
jgi:CheY-like chemotaxis protein